MVSEKKIKAVEELKNHMEKYRVIALVELFKMPSSQLHKIRRSVKGEAFLKVVKKSTLEFAIKKLNKPNVEELEKFMPSQPAILLTNLDPFRFYMKISQLKFPIFAKEGDTAPRDIVIPAGPTSLLPGPLISEFSKVGIPTSVEGGKISIRKDTVVAKRGEKISKEIASILRKLEIRPMELGLNIVCIYSDGKIYTREVLDLVGDAYLDRLKEAFQRALSLSIGIAYPTRENINYLISKAFNIASSFKEKIGVG